MRDNGGDLQRIICVMKEFVSSGTYNYHQLSKNRVCSLM